MPARQPRRGAGGGRGGGGAPAAAGPVLPAHCRVAATLKPSADSVIDIEVWMPESASWNGKFQAVGNGGWAGVISYAAMATAVGEGYATASTDTGHKGGNALFAIDHPEKLTDFAYRAVHEMTVQAKAIIDEVLRPRSAPVVLERLLDRRTPGADVRAAVSRGLRRDPRRRSGELPDASARLGSVASTPGLEGHGGRGAGGEARSGEQGGAERLRRPATASPTAC